MIRYIILFLILKSILLGCSLCSTFTPRTHISTHIKADNENIKSINIKWEFAEQFGDELLKIYDLNLDNTFDDKELKLIEDSLIDYLISRNFITTIYYDKVEDAYEMPFEVKKYKMYYKNRILSFEYDIEVEQKIYDKNILKIRIFDKEGFFFIVFENKNQKFDIPYNIKKNTNISEVSYMIDAPQLSDQKFSQGIIQSNIENEKLVDKWTKNIDEKNIDEEVDTIIEEEKPKDILDEFTSKVKQYLVDIENGDKFALFFLIIASFIYGVVHSIGPGHGKSLAFSYFSSAKSTYLEALIISFLTAFIHIIGALIIVVISIFILQTVLSGFIADSVIYITALSASIIMLLAIFILYRKLTKKSCGCASCNIDLKTTNFNIKPQNKNINFVVKTTNIPVHLEQRSKKQDLIFVLTAGIVPCPGTVLLFVYAFLLKTYFAVFLASLSISLGMAVVIFASSFLGVSLHKVSSNSKKLVNTLEIIAPIFMFILAFLMLISSGVFV
ncbi:DUF1007 family protein [Aliarcobacter lanthieri]|uniref:HoxN/HupN/NixA family nickel/cobalt transporter n=1 Tax=Aliarcobacter lanthieri TaxID=1355374 RepID=UPI003AADB817